MATERQDFARKLRRQSTAPEDILWSLLRAHRLDGLKFRRQVPLLGYTVDFLCFQRKLVVELDGRQHGAERDYDAARTQEIERHGFTLIRFRNETVLNDRDTVIAAIREALGTATQKPSPVRRGQGEVSAVDRMWLVFWQQCGLRPAGPGADTRYLQINSGALSHFAFKCIAAYAKRSEPQRRTLSQRERAG